MHCVMCKCIFMLMSMYIYIYHACLFTEQASLIGKPVNVTHSGASNVDDAKKLIESLMMGQSTDSSDLPAPLLPPSETSGNSANATGWWFNITNSTP